MPIFKISSDLNDKSAICVDCEYGATPGNPVVRLGRSKDGKRDLFGHVNCASARDRKTEAEELAFRGNNEKSEEEGIFAFASKFRYIATNSMTRLPENSTVESTFPVLKGNGGVDDMTTKQVDANYVDGAPVPPKN
jgi:hypothetical protein